MAPDRPGRGPSRPRETPRPALSSTSGGGDDQLASPRGGSEDAHRDRAAGAPDRAADVLWIGVALEIFTAIGAIPIGVLFIRDPSGGALQLTPGWIEERFAVGTYLIPGLYLLAVNGFGMLALAILSVRRHWIAPWLTGTLGVG